ncbi:hypothetical protein [Natrarchaeobaculum sulfurireducens]|nr:hypothetical protein [Natrarchaeobaculum sulfurireducens]
MPLRDEVEDGVLDDPKDRSDAAPMVLTSLPDTGLLYPHVIVERADQSSEQLDRHADVWEDDFDVQVTVHHKSSTGANKLIDGVVAWFKENQWELHRNGFMDTSVGPVTDANWESDPKIHTVQVTLFGRLNTTP